MLAARGERALRVDDSTIEISAKDVVGTEKVKNINTRHTL